MEVRKGAPLDRWLAVPMVVSWESLKADRTVQSKERQTAAEKVVETVVCSVACSVDCWARLLVGKLVVYSAASLPIPSAVRLAARWAVCSVSRAVGWTAEWMGRPRAATMDRCGVAVLVGPSAALLVVLSAVWRDLRTVEPSDFFSAELWAGRKAGQMVESLAALSAADSAACSVVA